MSKLRPAHLAGSCAAVPRSAPRRCAGAVKSGHRLAGVGAGVAGLAGALAVGGVACDLQQEAAAFMSWWYCGTLKSWREEGERGELEACKASARTVPRPLQLRQLPQPHLACASTAVAGLVVGGSAGAGEGRRLARVRLGIAGSARPLAAVGVARHLQPSASMHRS